MKRKGKQTKNVNLLPFHIIKAASEGDIGAIHKVLSHYEGYIARLSIQCLDETLRKRLETKLITKILNFEIA